MLKVAASICSILLLLSAIACSSASEGTVTPTGIPTPSVTPEQTPSPDHIPLSSLPSVADVVEKVRPAVAYISVEYLYTSFFAQTLLTKTGSGVILSPDGYILTNSHVVEDFRKVEVLIPDGDHTYEAQVVGTDPLSDLAVIKIGGADLPYAEFGDTSQLRIGDWVIALGNALGLEGGPTVTLGIVANLERAFAPGEIGQGQSAFYDVIQTDADINQGNSGGPLVNLEGKVIGINTFVIASGVETAGFAVNASTASRVYQEILLYGRVIRPYLGVNLRTLTPALSSSLGLARDIGVIVSYVQEGSPADEAGLEVEDVIVALQDEPVNEAYELTKRLWQYEVGDTVKLTFWRGSDPREVTIDLGERPSQS
jgi:serine protease Do